MTNCIDFDGEWYGWRLRGRHLVSPTGQRITRQRLEGLLWRDELELRRAGYASRRAAEANRQSPQYEQRVRVVIVPLADVLIQGQRAG